MMETEGARRATGVSIMRARTRGAFGWGSGQDSLLPAENALSVPEASYEGGYWAGGELSFGDFLFDELLSFLDSCILQLGPSMLMITE